MLTMKLKFVILIHAGCLAQLGEHLLDVQKVIGSIPIAPTIEVKIVACIATFLLN